MVEHKYFMENLSSYVNADLLGCAQSATVCWSW